MICEEFNKGTIYNSVVRVREIPSIMCLGLVTVELLCYKSQTEGEGRECVWGGEGCLRILSKGIGSVKGGGWSIAILQQWNKEIHIIRSHFFLSNVPFGSQRAGEPVHISL